MVGRVFLPQLDQGELQTADGRQFSISTRPLGYRPGQILLLSDVTQTRRLQRAAQQNLHLMTMGRMMASLAHQIRTPLSSAMLVNMDRVPPEPVLEALAAGDVEVRPMISEHYRLEDAAQALRHAAQTA